jgi:hypothetical protein
MTPVATLRNRGPSSACTRRLSVLALLATTGTLATIAGAQSDNAGAEPSHAGAGSKNAVIVDPVNFRTQTHAVFYNDVWSSPDGVNWTKRRAPPWPQGPCNKGPLDRGIIVGSVVFNERLWLIGGGSYATTNPDCRNVGSNEVWSWDGIDSHPWVEETRDARWLPRIYHNIFVFGDQMWVMAGVHNTRSGAQMLCDVWSSSDGRHWSSVSNPAPWPGRHAASVWVYESAVYMEGGTGARGPSEPCPVAAGSAFPLGDVWKYSQQPSGEYGWTQLLRQGEAPFRPHDAAGALVYNNRMWLIGGWNPKLLAPKTLTNEVWNSADGIHWTQVKRNTFVPGVFNPLTDWEGRHMAGWVVFNNKMWIVGGDNNAGHYQSDIWNSEDGAHWTRVTDSPQWSMISAGGGPRVLHYTVVFKGQIYVIGGQTLPETIGYNVHAIIDTLLLHQAAQ